jgi:hypothetical protein
MESKKRLPEYTAKKPANTGLRSQYALRLYGWAKKHVESRTMSISLEDLRKVLGLESIKDTDGNVIQEPPWPIWANFRQRALDTAIVEISKKTDLRIAIKSLVYIVALHIDRPPISSEDSPPFTSTLPRPKAWAFGHTANVTLRLTAG